MNDPLVDDLARLLDGQPAGLSCDGLRARVNRRRTDVLATLRADPRFQHVGAGSRSRWQLSDRRGRRRDGSGRVDRPGST